MATKKFLDLTGLSKYDELIKGKISTDIAAAKDELSAEIAKRVILNKGEDTDTVALTVTDGKLTASVKGNVVVDAEYSTVKSNANNAAAAWNKFLEGSSDVSPVLADLATETYASDAASAAQAAAIAAAATDAATKANDAKDAAIAAAAADAKSKAEAAQAAAIAAAAIDATTKANDAKNAAIDAAAADAKSKADAAQAAAEATAAADATSKADAAQAAAEATAAADATSKANDAKDAAIAAAKTYTDNQIDAANSDINTEIAGLKSADTLLDGRISSIETLITADGEDDTIINKVSEIIKFFEGVQEEEVYTNLVAKVAANETAIATEASAREAADSVLDGKIAANTAAIATEASAREAADSELDGKITAEASAREAADSVLDGKIAANAKAITDGDAATLASAKSYTDEAKNAANAYTDDKIAALDVCEAIDTADIEALFD